MSSRAFLTERGAHRADPRGAATAASPAPLRGQRRRGAAWLAATVLLAAVSAWPMGGCRQAATSQPGATQPAGPVEKVAERGPVKVRVRLDKDRVTIAEPVTLEVEATAEPDVDVRMPSLGKELGALAVRDFRAESPRDGGPPVWRQRYTLDSFLSGEIDLPAFRVAFVDRRQRGGATTQPIESVVEVEPLRLTVTSLLDGEFDPQKFNDIKGAVTLPLPRSYVAALWAGGAVLALAVVAAATWWWRRRQGRRQTVRVPPHQWAMIELEKLVGEDLVGRGQIREFYYRLNGLLRRYVELRFSLAASEQTSEEFLRELGTDHRLGAGHKQALQQFITACDTVKYARYQPGKEEIEQVFAAARDFIWHTREQEKEVELEAAA